MCRYIENIYMYFGCIKQPEKKLAQIILQPCDGVTCLHQSHKMFAIIELTL